jgi:hypothetical protein
MEAIENERYAFGTYPKLKQLFDAKNNLIK